MTFPSRDFNDTLKSQAKKMKKHKRSLKNTLKSKCKRTKLNHGLKDNSNSIVKGNFRIHMFKETYKSKVKCILNI